MPELHDISRAIGQLEGTVRAAVEGLTRVEKNQADNATAFREALAGQSRDITDLTGIISDMQAQLTAFKTRSDEQNERSEADRENADHDLQKQIDEMKPITNKVKEFQFESRGALWIIRGAFLGLASIAGYLLTKIEGWIFHK